HPGPLLPRPLLAAHTRLRTTRLCRRRRGVHRTPARPRRPAIGREGQRSRPADGRRHRRRVLAMENHEHHHDHDAAEATATFPTDTAGLPQAAPTEVVDLADGDTFEL